MALVAHDGKKAELIAFVSRHKKVLSKFNLIATYNTGHMIERETGLRPKYVLSGPLGGDQQIGALVATEKLDVLIFFRDPLTSQPHDPDINALVRVCDVHNIPVATNPATALCIIKSL